MTAGSAADIAVITAVGVLAICLALLAWRLARRLAAETARRRQAQAALRVAIESMDEAAVLIDADSRLSAFSQRYAGLTSFDAVFPGRSPHIGEALQRRAGPDACVADGNFSAETPPDQVFDHHGRHYRRKCMALPGGGFIATVSDMTEATEHSRAEQALREKDAQLRQLLELAPIAILASSRANGDILFANPKAQEVANSTAEDMARSKVQDFYCDHADREHLLTVLAREGVVRDFEAPFRRTDGSVIWALVSSIYGEFDGQPAVISVLGDISVRKRMEDELKQARAALQKANSSLQRANQELAAAASTDSLTGLPNRRCLENAATTEIERARRYGHPLSVILFDIDWFKAVNDGFGHATGDAVLCELGARLTDRMRSSDVFARWGGEEFLLLAPSATLDEAAVLAEKIRCLIEEEPFSGAGRLTASFGVAGFDGVEDFSTLVGRADRALYAAKAGGRNRVERGERDEAVEL